MRYKLFYVLLGLLLWGGCNDDSETITPTTKAEMWYQLPQGDHPYDDRIMDWFNRCDFYMLYKFEPKDIYFDGDSEWAEMYADTVWNTTAYTINYPFVIVMEDQVYLTFEDKTYTIGEHVVDGLIQNVKIEDNTVIVSEQKVKMKGKFLVKPAEEEYVGKQLEFVEEIFLNFYSDDVLRRGMLKKVILGRELRVSFGEEAQPKSTGYKASFNSLIFDFGDESLASVDLAFKREIKINLHEWFLNDRFLNSVRSIAEAAGFFNVTNYSLWVNKPQAPTADKSYGLGMLQAMSVSSLSSVQEYDLKKYIEIIIKHSKQKLTSEPANGNYDFYDFTGILHPKKDVNGLILKKYNILVKSLKDAGIDIAAIGELYQ